MEACANRRELNWFFCSISTTAAPQAPPSWRQTRFPCLRVTAAQMALLLAASSPVVLSSRSGPLLRRWHACSVHSPAAGRRLRCVAALKQPGVGREQVREGRSRRFMRAGAWRAAPRPRRLF